MLFRSANDQFLAAVKTGVDSGLHFEQLKSAIERYGGSIINFTPGMVTIYRDAFEALMVLEHQSSNPEEPLTAEKSRAALSDEIKERINHTEHSALLGRVYLDTRCVLFFDADLLQNAELISKYKELRRSGKEKEGRDFLRDHGAAVRYGFNRQGDELGVFRIVEDKVVALRPDVVG